MKLGEVKEAIKELVTTFLYEIGNNRIKNEYIYKKKVEEEKKDAR